MREDSEKCPVCNRRLHLSTSRVLSYRLVPSYDKPVKRQHLEIVATSKWCLCGYCDRQMNERMIGEVKVKTS